MTFEEARKQNPRMRRLQPVGIIQNGSRKTVVECCLCGLTHSYASNWPKPVVKKKFQRIFNETT